MIKKVIRWKIIGANTPAGWHSIVKTTPALTPQLVAHLKKHRVGSFTITFNAGVEDGDWLYDFCELMGQQAKDAVDSFVTT